MKANNNSPAIRFAGFVDAWKQSQLGDNYARIGNAFVGTATPYYVNEGHLYLESNNIKNGHINRNTEVFINDEFYIKQKEKWLHTGDIVMVQSGHVGHTAVIPEELNNSAAHALIVFQSPKKQVNPHFLNYEFQTSYSKNKIDNITTGNTIKHILASDMKAFIVSLPSSNEQNTIGAFFQNIDSLIHLHQRKYEKLVNLKKAMLDKMFPKNGELVPAVRFAGFSGNWERRKLGEIAYKVTEKNYAEAISETFTNSAENGIISQREYFDHDISNPSNLAGYFVVQENDFIYNPRISSTAPVGPVNRNKLNRKGLVSPIYTVFRTYEIDNLYLEYFFKTRHWHPYMFYNGDSGARSDRFSIKDSLFMSMPIVLPSQSEQKSIGRFLECVDSIIMLQHQKLERLQNLKKAFLEKMFV